MSDLRISGNFGERDVISAIISLPRSGRWTADLEIDHTEAITGAVTLARPDGSLSLAGTVVPARTGVYEQVATCHVVAGSGGLDREIESVGYEGTTLDLPLRAILGATGERLSPRTDRAVLAHYLPHWTRQRGRGYHELSRLCDAAGVTWRVDDDGSVWLGTDTYPTVRYDDFELTEHRPDEYVDMIATDQIPGVIRPGVTWGERRVSAVEWQYSADGLLTKIQYARTASTLGDPLLDAMATIARQATSSTDYHRVVRAVVRSQRADGTLEVEPVDGRYPKISGVPIRGLGPGIAVEVSAGARVQLAWEDGDPSLPVAVLWEASGSNLVRLRIGANATLRAARDTDSVPCGTLVIAVTGTGVAVSGTYTPPGGAPQPLPSGASITVDLMGKIAVPAGQSKVLIE